jgi:AraC family transcriptional regulator, regulatory protein of adaptative response / DNA-3-methyladenine glycosylase II
VELDRIACYRAVQARDARFDGRFFTAVRTTGIYCRPICPARTPRLENVTFYRSLVEAQDAGYRPCLRCRPEASPDLDGWLTAPGVMSRALELIAAGVLDGENGGVGGLAARLGIGERHLRRVFRDELGVPPTSVAQTRRVLFAKQLLQETRMSMTDVALAAGFGSVRRFNDTFRALYRRPPSALRRQSTTGSLGGNEISSVTLHLGYAPPYDWSSIIEFLAARAIPGVEIVEGDRYRRTIELNGRHGTIEVTAAIGRDALAATIRFPDPRALPTIVRRIRRVFDLGVDVAVITAQLEADPVLEGLVRARPGLRVPGAWDGFELGVRAVLGQQITVTGARRLIGRLVEAHGEPLRSGDRGFELNSTLTSVFPTPRRLARTDLGLLGMPRARAAAIAGLATAADVDPDLFRRGASLHASIARLTTLPGIGEWTAQYIAMRALREPDAFPAADVGLLRALTGPDGRRPTPAAVLTRAEAWRPWRAYAAQHLWTSLTDGSAASRSVQDEKVA